MILEPNPVSSASFTYDPHANLLVSEASTVGCLARVYDDACDVGLTVVSVRTGRKVVYVLDGNIRDSEGEVIVDVLKPVSLRDSGLPLLHLIND